MKLFKRIIAGIFADWNGLQNLLAPSALIFLFDEYSFINWITGIFSYHRYYIPLLLYCTFAMTMVFWMMKALFAWDRVKSDAEREKVPSEVTVIQDELVPSGVTVIQDKLRPERTFGRDFLAPYLIHIHLLLLYFFTLFMLLYIVKGVYNAIWQGSFPFVPIAFWLLRIGFVAGFVYNYVLIDLYIPLVAKGHSWKRTQRYQTLRFRSRARAFLMVGIVQLVWIYVSVLVFKLIVNLLDSLIVIIGLGSPVTGVVISFLKVEGVWHFSINVMMLLTAFLVLNLLYYPLIILLNRGFEYFKINFRDL
jgi:hypothetical protein